MSNKLRVGIYAPCKNEIKHIDDWYNSCKNADVIHVADTGSTDGSRERLIELGVNVTDMRIKPWRFDFAFNFAMALLPEDVDVCIRLDMDERLEDGWRELLEEAWTPETTRLRYTYVWNWVSPGVPGRQWLGDRIHARSGYYWMSPTHEGLCCRTQEVQSVCDKLRILQFPDIKDKNGDLPLLEEAVREAPHDSRMWAYLGREYMYRGMKDKCIETYKKFLTMQSWNVERGLAMQNLANVDEENKEYWLKSAILETPNHREPLVELARHYYHLQNWGESYKYSTKALAITNHPMDYTCNEDSWGWLPHDLAAIASWNLGLKQESLQHSKNAMDADPGNERLQNNYRIIKEWFINEGISIT